MGSFPKTLIDPEFHIFELWNEEWMQRWSLRLNMQLMQLLKESLKKKNHAYQDLILDLCDTSAALGPNQ